MAVVMDCIEEGIPIVKDKGREATGVAYEMYLNDPQQTPPQALQTLIMFPLKPA